MTHGPKIEVGSTIKFLYGRGERIWGKVLSIGDETFKVSLLNQPAFEPGSWGDEVELRKDAINDRGQQGFVFEFANSTA